VVKLSKKSPKDNNLEKEATIKEYIKKNNEKI